MRRRIIIIFTALLVTAAVIAYFAPRAVIAVVSARHGLATTYRDLQVLDLRTFRCKDLKVLDKKKGVGIVANDARVRIDALSPRAGMSAFTFEMSRVRFTAKAQGRGNHDDTLLGIVMTPFKSKWRYKTIRGSIVNTPEGTMLKDCSASGDEIELAISGRLLSNETIDADIAVAFSPDTAETMPDMVSQMVFKERPDGWRSFSARLTGDARTPSIQMTGNLFRLNIGAVTRREPAK